MRLLLLSLALSSTAFATVKPEVPQKPVATANADASAGSVSTSNSGSFSTASTGPSNANNSIHMEDRLQAPSIAAPSLFASGVCSGGGSIGLSIPGGGISGGRSKEIQGCERREWYRLLRDTSPALALRIACSDPVVAAVAKPGDCDYTHPATATNEVECRSCTKPSDAVTKQELNDVVDRAFKKAISK